MKTITLEIHDERDITPILDFIQKFNVRVVDLGTVAADRQEVLAEATAYWQEQGVAFPSFVFNREEANER